MVDKHALDTSKDEFDEELYEKAKQKALRRQKLTAEEEKLLRMRHGIPVGADIALTFEMPRSSKAAQAVLAIELRALAELKRRQKAAKAVRLVKA